MLFSGFYLALNRPLGKCLCTTVNIICLHTVRTVYISPKKVSILCFFHSKLFLNTFLICYLYSEFKSFMLKIHMRMHLLSVVKLSKHYLYHSRKKSSLNQTQERINDLEHSHHLAEIHHISCGVESIVKRICGDRETGRHS